MTDRLVIQSEQDTSLKKELEKVEWPVDYGIITVKVRDGKPSLVTIERTVKMD